MTILYPLLCHTDKKKPVKPVYCKVKPGLKELLLTYKRLNWNRRQNRTQG